MPYIPGDVVSNTPEEMGSRTNSDEQSIHNSRDNNRYTFGQSGDLTMTENYASTAKRLRQRLVRQQSGISVGRRMTGDSVDSKDSGTPTDTGRSFTFTAIKGAHGGGPGGHGRGSTAPTTGDSGSTEPNRFMLKDVGEMIMEAIHMDDTALMERLLGSAGVQGQTGAGQTGGVFGAMLRCQSIQASDSVGSTQTLSDLAQRRHGGGASHRRSNASIGHLGFSSGAFSRSYCVMHNTLHLALMHKQRDIVELLLKSGYDANAAAVCQCKSSATVGCSSLATNLITSRAHSITATDLCTTCAGLRTANIMDQSPLELAVRVQSPALIHLLCTYGADVNAAHAEENDGAGNTPLHVAVRDSPISWECVETLIFYGAKIEHKNQRGLRPIDLCPELSRLQKRCTEELLRIAWSANGRSAGAQSIDIVTGGTSSSGGATSSSSTSHGGGGSVCGASGGGGGATSAADEEHAGSGVLKTLLVISSKPGLAVPSWRFVSRGSSSSESYYQPRGQLTPQISQDGPSLSGTTSAKLSMGGAPSPVIVGAQANPSAAAKPPLSPRLSAAPSGSIGSNECASPGFMSGGGGLQPGTGSGGSGTAGGSGARKSLVSLQLLPVVHNVVSSFSSNQQRGAGGVTHGGVGRMQQTYGGGAASARQHREKERRWRWCMQKWDGLRRRGAQESRLAAVVAGGAPRRQQLQLECATRCWRRRARRCRTHAAHVRRRCSLCPATQGERT